MWLASKANIAREADVFNAFRIKFDYPPFQIPYHLKAIPPRRDNYNLHLTPPTKLETLLGRDEWYRRAQAKAESEYQMALRACEDKTSKFEVEVNRLKEDYEEARQKALREAEERNTEIDKLEVGYERGQPVAIANYISLVFRLSRYPLGFPTKISVKYDPHAKTLALDWNLPRMDVLPEVPQSDRELLYVEVLAGIALRATREVFGAETRGYISIVLFNGYLDSYDRATGNRQRIHLVALRVQRDSFIGIDFSRINAWECFKKLGGTIEAQPIVPAKRRTPSLTQAEDPTEKALKHLKQLTGLVSVKSEVEALVNLIKIQQLRASRGLSNVPVSRHLVFYGNPGTGKTTVARLIAQIYQLLGVLRTGHLVETDRSGLVAGYLGQTAIKTREIIESALGGMLFIDEAYSLKNRDDDSFGQEAVDTLLKLMEDNRDDLVVVVAGYTHKMETFLETNPGFRSRFNKYLYFDDYAPLQLLAIFKSFSAEASLTLSDFAETKLLEVFQTLYSGKDETFGNARLARNVFERAVNNQANRLVGLIEPDNRVLSTIDASDIPQAIDLCGIG